MDTALDHVTLGQVIAVAAFAGGAWAAVRKVIPGLRRFFRAWDEIAGVPGDPERPGLMKKVDEVHHELFANSGESLRDQVDIIRDRQEEQAKALVGLADANAAKAAALEQLAARLEQHITDSTPGTHSDPTGAEPPTTNP